MIDFSTLKGLTIPEGVVTQIADASGRVIWAVQNNEPVVLQVEKITSDTYAGETLYEGEQFILLDIYPNNANSTVKVTYGGLTKTIKFSGTNAHQVYFGTFNGVADSVATPASGEMVIEDGCKGFAVGSYKQYSYDKDHSHHCGCITGVTNWGAIKELKEYAFDSCAKLTNIEFPKGMYRIPSYAFRNCVNLTLTSLPSGLTSIGDYSFYNCSGITLSDIPHSVTTIGQYAFSGCTGLSEITLTNVSSIGNYAFVTTAKDMTVIINSMPTFIGQDAFEANGGVGISIADKARHIYFNDDAWSWDAWVDAENVPRTWNDVQSWTGGAYRHKYYVYINDVLTSEIPTVMLESCIAIPAYAFWGFDSITTITIPKSVTTIGDDAFFGCRELKQVVCLAETPPIIGNQPFSVYYVSTITVPKGCGETYKTAEGWSNYADYIVEASE